MKSTATLLTATATGGDKGARLGYLADLIERAAGASASGLSIVNHGEAQGSGVHTVGTCPDHALLTVIDASGVSHAFILSRKAAGHLAASLIDLGKRDYVKRDPRGPITKPGGGIS